MHDEPEALRKLGVLAGKIAYFNFEWLYVALLVFNTPEALGVMSFMKTYKNPVIMELGKYKPRHRNYVPQIGIFLETTAELVDFIQWIVEAGYDNTAKFIIVCVNTDPDECDEYAVFESCLKHKIPNVVFLKPSNTTDPLAFTYWPVKPGKCYDHQPEKININWDCPTAKCFDNTFPEKMDNMHRCVISVSTFEQHPYMYILEDGKTSGLDGYILEIIIKALNATLEIVVPPEEHWGHYINDTWSGSMGDIFYERANMSLCAAPLTMKKFTSFQISYTYNSIDMVWVAQSPDKKPSWERLIYPFKIYIRIVTFLLFVGIVIINISLKTKRIKKMLKVINLTPPKCSLLFYSWFLFLGMPLSREPSKFAVLAIVYSWIWFAFLMRSTYTGGLYGSLKVNQYEAKFDTLNDVIRSRRPFGGPVSLKEYYLEDDFVYNNWRSIILENRYDELGEIARGESEFAMAMNFEVIIEYISYYKGSISMQIIPEKIANTPVVAFFKKYSPLAPPVSHVLSALQEGGFTERLHSQFMKQGKVYFQVETFHINEPLRLEHFAGSIGILLFGWIFATIFFLVELFCEKWSALIRKYV